MDGCGSSGMVDDPSASPLAAAAVLDGRRLYPRRADLQAVIAVDDPTRSAAVGRAVTQTAAAREAHSAPTPVPLPPRRRVRGCRGRTGRRRQALSDAELAELGCALTDPAGARHCCMRWPSARAPAQAESLWAVLARTLPPPWRVEALVLLAFSAYARGDGPLAGVSLEAALRCDAGHRMAGMLDTALQSGLRPEHIRDLAVTGYRLAERLGVRLPPRRAFGRRAG